MRWNVVAPLREAPEYRALSRSRQEVLWFLWRRADDDGVVRKQICIRRMAERLNLPRETVRKCLQHLDRHGVILRRPGSGRARSLYVVPIAWDLPLTDPDAEPPASSSAGTATTPKPGTSPAGALSESATAAGSTNSSTRPEWIPRRPAVQQLALPAPRPASAGELVDEPEQWCARARAEGARHANSRCCGTTARQIEARRKTAAAAAARAERERRAAAEREQRAQYLSSEPTQKEIEARAEARAVVNKTKGTSPNKREEPP